MLAVFTIILVNFVLLYIGAELLDRVNTKMNAYTLGLVGGIVMVLLDYVIFRLV